MYTWYTSPLLVTYCSKFSLATSPQQIQGKMAPNPFNMKVNADGYLNEHWGMVLGQKA